MKISWSDNGNLVSVSFDATPGETHMISATVTEHPVESGAPISDNVRAGPFKITLDVVITNTPLVIPSAEDDSFTDGVTLDLKQLDLSPLLGQADLIAQPAQGSTPATIQQKAPLKSGREDVPYYAAAQTFQASSQFDRVRRIYEALTTLVGTDTLVTIQTTLALYDSMAIIGLSVPRSAQMGKAIRFSVDCQQVLTVETEETAAPAPKHQPKQAGHKSTKPLDEKQDDDATFEYKALVK